MAYKGSVHILFIYSYEIVHFYSYVVRSRHQFPNAAVATHVRVERQVDNAGATS
jgi:hypothetical protein